MKKYNRNINISNLICPDCKNTFPIPRINGNSRNKGHIKTIWCPFCKKERNMIEYRIGDIYKNYFGELIEH